MKRRTSRIGFSKSCSDSDVKEDCLTHSPEQTRTRHVYKRHPSRSALIGPTVEFNIHLSMFNADLYNPGWTIVFLSHKYQ